MKKHSLAIKGLSMSDAQSISNLCNQRALDIDNKLDNVKTANKSIVIAGVTHVIVQKTALPDNVLELLLEKGKFHACQAFLMENIKAKEQLFLLNQKARPDLTSIVEPEYPNLHSFRPLSEVLEEWGWEQLSSNEVSEYLESEALAAHIGRFIHKGSKLETLRNELSNLVCIEWKEVRTGVQTPVTVEANHTSEYLQQLHEKLSQLHKKHEARVNYFKAKVKNLVTAENGRIAKLNADRQLIIQNFNKDLMTDYNTLMSEYTTEVTKVQNAFEIERSKKVAEIAALRIEVDSRFQPIIDKFLVTTT